MGKSLARHSVRLLVMGLSLVVNIMNLILNIHFSISNGLIGLFFSCLFAKRIFPNFRVYLCSTPEKALLIFLLLLFVAGDKSKGAPRDYTSELDAFKEAVGVNSREFDLKLAAIGDRQARMDSQIELMASGMVDIKNMLGQIALFSALSSTPRRDPSPPPSATAILGDVTPSNPVTELDSAKGKALTEPPSVIMTSRSVDQSVALESFSGTIAVKSQASVRAEEKVEVPGATHPVVPDDTVRKNLMEATKGPTTLREWGDENESDSEKELDGSSDHRSRSALGVSNTSLTGVKWTSLTQLDKLRMTSAPSAQSLGYYRNNKTDTSKLAWNGEPQTFQMFKGMLGFYGKRIDAWTALDIDCICSMPFGELCTIVHPEWDDLFFAVVMSLHHSQKAQEISARFFEEEVKWAGIKLMQKFHELAHGSVSPLMMAIEHLGQLNRLAFDPTKSDGRLNKFETDFSRIMRLLDTANENNPVIPYNLRALVYLDKFKEHCPAFYSNHGLALLRDNTVVTVEMVENAWNIYWHSSKGKSGATGDKALVTSGTGGQPCKCCGDTKHVSADCWIKGRTEPVICRKCQKAGHIKKACTSKAKVEESKQKAAADK